MDVSQAATLEWILFSESANAASAGATPSRVQSHVGSIPGLAIPGLAIPGLAIPSHVGSIPGLANQRVIIGKHPQTWF